MALDIFSEYRFMVKAGATVEYKITANYIYFFDFASNDATAPAMLEVSFNYSQFATLRETFELDLTEVVRGAAGSAPDDDTITSVRISNRGTADVTGYFGTSDGRIRTNITAIGGTDTALPVDIRKPSPLITADLASLDDSGIVLTSDLVPTLAAIRGAANQNVTNPRGYQLSTTSLFTYSGLEVGKLYAYDFERIESLPQWWGKGGSTQTGDDYRIDISADIRAFIYNGSGASQKRGYRRGGLLMNWTGEMRVDSYGNILQNRQTWNSASGAFSVTQYAGSTTFAEQKIEDRPFLFKATAATLSIQFFITGEVRWGQAGQSSGTPPFGSAADSNLGSGGLRVRHSVQPITEGALV